MTQEQGLGASLPNAKEIIEALFFATDEPLTAKQVVDIFQTLDENERPQKLSEEAVQGIFERWAKKH